MHYYNYLLVTTLYDEASCFNGHIFNSVKIKCVLHKKCALCHCPIGGPSMRFHSRKIDRENINLRVQSYGDLIYSSLLPIYKRMYMQYGSLLHTKWLYYLNHRL